MYSPHRARWLTRVGPVLPLVMTLWCVPASGQSASNKAAAEALFEQGRALMQQQNYEAACVKLQASQEQDPGLGTMMLLSDCYEKVGKTASAWASFKDAAAAARVQGDTDREEVARARAEALEPVLSKALVQGADATMAIKGLQVVVNGDVVPPAQLGTPVPVDPGPLAVEVTAPGYKPWQLTVEVPKGAGETTVNIPLMVPEQGEKVEHAAPKPLASEAESPPPATPEERISGSQLKTTGIVLGAGGIVGLGLGTVFGLRASSKNDSSQDHCPTVNQCYRKGVELRDQAKNAATVSTISFGVGTALLASGVLLYLLAPEATEAPSAFVSPQIGSDGAGLNVGGEW